MYNGVGRAVVGRVGPDLQGGYTWLVAFCEESEMAALAGADNPNFHPASASASKVERDGRSELVLAPAKAWGQQRGKDFRSLVTAHQGDGRELNNKLDDGVRFDEGRPKVLSGAG
jgi:hypothetical protein